MEQAYRKSREFGKKRRGRLEENIQAVSEQFQNNPHLSVRRNSVGLPKPAFKRDSVNGLLSSNEISVSYDIL